MIVGKVIGQYEITKQLAAGGTTVVYQGKHIEDGSEVALKMEDGSKDGLLGTELAIYRLLGDIESIPRAVWYGNHDGKDVMLMSLLGPSLEDLFLYCNRRFSLKTVLLLADQLLYITEVMHRTGVVHRDISPSNILMGRVEHASRAFLVGLSQAQLYSQGNSKEGRGKSKNSSLVRSKLFTDALRFASLNEHLGAASAPRDDLESLALMLVYFLNGDLPWQGISASTQEQKVRLVAHRKATTSIDDLCSGLPREFRYLLTYARNLGSQDMPAYRKLRHMLRKLFRSLGYAYDGRFDWVAKTHAELPKYYQPHLISGVPGGGGGGLRVPTPPHDAHHYQYQPCNQGNAPSPHHAYAMQAAALQRSALWTRPLVNMHTTHNTQGNDVMACQQQQYHVGMHGSGVEQQRRARARVTPVPCAQHVQDVRGYREWYHALTQQRSQSAAARFYGDEVVYRRSGGQRGEAAFSRGVPQPCGRAEQQRPSSRVQHSQMFKAPQQQPRKPQQQHGAGYQGQTVGVTQQTPSHARKERARGSKDRHSAKHSVTVDSAPMKGVKPHVVSLNTPAQNRNAPATAPAQAQAIKSASCLRSQPTNATKTGPVSGPKTGPVPGAASGSRSCVNDQRSCANPKPTQSTQAQPAPSDNDIETQFLNFQTYKTATVGAMRATELLQDSRPMCPAAQEYKQKRRSRRSRSAIPDIFNCRVLNTSTGVSGNRFTPSPVDNQGISLHVVHEGKAWDPLATTHSCQPSRHYDL